METRKNLNLRVLPKSKRLNETKKLFRFNRQQTIVNRQTIQIQTTKYRNTYRLDKHKHIEANKYKTVKNTIKPEIK